MTRANVYLQPDLDESGRIHEPASIDVALARVDALEVEMLRIVEQLSEEIRRTTFGAYEADLDKEWRKRAANKFKLFTEERKQLVQWVRHKDTEATLQVSRKDAEAAFRVLDSIHELDLDESEQQLRERLRKVLNPT